MTMKIKTKWTESFSTWHRENKNNENENFLRFELESGTKTNMMGDTARESEDGDQALGLYKVLLKKVHNPTLMALIQKKQGLHTF